MGVGSGRMISESASILVSEAYFWRGEGRVYLDVGKRGVKYLFPDILQHLLLLRILSRRLPPINSSLDNTIRPGRPQSIELGPWPSTTHCITKSNRIDRCETTMRGRGRSGGGGGEGLGFEELLDECEFGGGVVEEDEEG